MKQAEPTSRSYRVTRRVLLAAGFAMLALYLLAMGVCLTTTWSTSINTIDRIRRESRPETPPGAEDLKRVSLVPAWQYEAGARIRRIVGLVGDKLILYTWDRQFIAVDTASGKLIWRYQSPGDITDLVSENEIDLKDGLLIFSSFIEDANRRLIALDAATGQELWHHDGEGGFVASTFAIGDQYIYWAIRPHYVAFDRYTGKLAWESELDTGTQGYDGLLYNGNELIIVRPDMYVLDARTGKTQRELKVKINSTPSRIDGNIIYVEKDESKLVRALDVQKDTVLWEKRIVVVSDSRWTPLLRASKLYVNLNGALGALDPTTGAVIWGKSTFEKGQPYLFSNPAFVGNTIYVIFSDGSLRTLNIADGAETARVEYQVVTEDAALYATDKSIFVSLGKPTLYAYTLLIDKSFKHHTELSVTVFFEQ